MTHRYTLVVRPDERVVTGRNIRLLATSPIAYSAPEVPAGELDTYDPHIVGRVMELRNVDGDPTRVRAIVKNICRRNSVREVEIDLPRIYSDRRPWE